MGGTPDDRYTDDLLRPFRAPVAPRVRLVGGGEALPLEERALRLLKLGECGYVGLNGPPGSGKTTALRHLSSVLPRGSGARFFDDSFVPPGDWRSSLAFIAAPPETTPANQFAAQFEMVPWGDDDVIEYLLAAHSDRCQAVMFKVKSYAQHLSLGGSPELWRMVLDTMAGDDSIPDVSAALRRCVAPLLSEPRMKAALACLAHLRRVRNAEGIDSFTRIDVAHRLVMHPPVQLLLASELIVRNLCDGATSTDLEGILPHDLIVETARLAAHWPAAIGRLEALVASKQTRTHPMAVSLLLAIRPEWKPAGSRVPKLSGAYAAGAHWAGVDLHCGSLSGADLERADLSSADLSGASITGSMLRGASLRSAKLDRAIAWNSDFTGAGFVGASAEAAQLRDAKLHGADLRSVSLRQADLSGADLSDAVLSCANLNEAVLDETNLDGADLGGADLSYAMLRSVRLHDTNCTGANFDHCDLQSCHMEGLSLPNGKLPGARLRGCYLTGAIMPNADFHGADLRNTGLADVEWAGVNLRGADLRGASFHMGSTRSGLVGSAIPCEGSKTGSYTDDFNDRDFKNPEEIRKANLCGADLRGARIKNVDFYLVDLRGAHYTDKQAHYFRRRGAILD